MSAKTRDALLRERALSRWDSEGGAVGPELEQRSPGGFVDMPDPTQAELIHLRVRVIALESLVTAILADGPDSRLVQAREMARFISPREGCTPHVLTLNAAAQMVELVDRVEHFRARD